MNAIKKMSLCMCMTLSTALIAQGKEWRGIVPLRSTRADVERLLGPPAQDPLSAGCKCLYQLDDENVHILYANGLPCGEGEQRDWRIGGWKVPVDTVIEISVFFKTERPLSDFKIDEKYEIETDNHLPGWIFYTQREEGIRIEGTKKTAANVSYFPAAKDSYLRCPNNQPERPPAPGEFPTKQRELFDSFALRLRLEPDVAGQITVDDRPSHPMIK
jgi:hypothetical protein